MKSLPKCMLTKDLFSRQHGSRELIRQLLDPPQRKVVDQTHRLPQERVQVTPCVRVIGTRVMRG
jgi:hypothetical protein